jgi:citrate/tricarballylate utilization protein
VQPLDALVAQAAHFTSAQAEVARQMQICNACRYCEGFCAVFPAMTRRLDFTPADVHYLANLCHNCGACLHACQYATPHEFAVNVPQAMAQVRGQTYADYAWPSALGLLYARNGLAVALALAAGLALFLLLAVAQMGSLGAVPPGGNFYAAFPHNLLVGLFAPVFLFVVLALALAVRRFWRDVSPPQEVNQPPGALPQALGNALTLRYLDGGHGEGCHNEDDRWTHARRRAHHLTFYGFLLCFASTSVATLYHYAFGWVAPYDLPSLPKLLGALGGVLLLLGSARMLCLRLARNPALVDPAQTPMDLGLIVLLLLTSFTGMGLWFARGQVGQTAWLAVHLGVVMALFVTLPYGKFAHGLFRCAALFKYQIERRQPDRLRLKSDA